MSDTSANGALPPDLEPVHQRLLADSAAWSAQVPSTDRLRVHTRQLVDGHPAAPEGTPSDLFEREDMDDIPIDTSLIRTQLRPRTPTRPSWMRGLFAVLAAAVVVLLLTGTLYALSARQGGIGGQATATVPPTPSRTDGIGVPGPQSQFVPSAAVALGVDKNGVPIGVGGTFKITDIIYAWAHVKGVQPGKTHTLTIRWYVNGQLSDFPQVPYSQIVTTEGYYYFRVKLAPGLAVAKLYWDLPEGASNPEASLAQTVTFTVVVAQTATPGTGATQTPAPSSPYIPSFTPSTAGTTGPPRSSGSSIMPTPTPAP